MTTEPRFMLNRPPHLYGRDRPVHTCRDGAARPFPPGGPARRGPPLPAHERRLLLSLGAHRSVGLDAATDAGIPLVPRGDRGPAVARDRRGERPVGRGWGARA